MPKSNAQLTHEMRDIKDKVKALHQNSKSPVKGDKTKVSKLLANTVEVFQRNLAQFMGVTHKGARRVWEQFSYPLTVTSDMYLERYNRQDIANRIIDTYPEACWKGDIQVTDQTETEKDTEFEQAYEKLSRDLKLINLLTRTDKLAGLGEYSVLFIGLNDGLDSKEPIVEGQTFESSDILFLKPFSQGHAEISKFNNDQASPRFGFPELYNLQVGESSTSRSSVNTAQTTKLVHWTRVIHVAEGALETDIIGLPRLLPIFNRLIDLEKVVGSSAELFWLNGRGGLNFNAPLDAQLENKAELQQDIENYIHELTRILRTRGMEVKPLQFSIPDPKSNVDVLLKLISAATGIPLRILTGSERGELASSQDKNNFEGRVQERQNDFCGPNMLRLTVDWFITRGILPEPKNGEYDIIFPAVGGLSEIEKADRAQKLSTSLANYINAFGVEEIIPKKQFVEEILQLDFKEADVEQSDNDEGGQDLLDSEDDDT